MSAFRDELAQLLEQGPPQPHTPPTLIDTREQDDRDDRGWCARVHGLAALVNTEPRPRINFDHEHRWHVVGWMGPGEKTEQCVGCGATRRVL